MSLLPYRIKDYRILNTPYTITKKDSHLLVSNANNKTFEIHKRTQQESAQQESTRQSQAAQSQSPQEDTKIYIDNTEFDNLAILTALLTLNENDKVSLSLRLCYQITLDMLKEVFEYTKAQDGIKTKMDTMLPQMVEELNRMQDNKPMYMHYNLDTRARLEHFFAQCYVEVGGSAFRLEEGLHYKATRLIETFQYYHSHNQSYNGIKEALLDGDTTNEKNYTTKDILNIKKALGAIKALIQESYINVWLNTTNNAINKSANTAEIEKNITQQEKEKLANKKAYTTDEIKKLLENYTPEQIIESFEFYKENLDNIKLAFKHAKMTLSKGTNYEILYSTESNKAFFIIANEVFKSIVSSRSDKKAKDVIIANKVYGGKYGNAPYDPNLTDQTQGDGYKYRGKGLIHLTWKENYKKFGEYATKQKWNITDKDYFFKNPLIVKNEALSALRAGVYFWNHHKLYSIADTYQTKDYTNNRKKIKKIIRSKTHTLNISINKSLDSITHKVNAGKENIEGRQDAFNRIRFGTYNITQAQLKSVATDLTELIESDENLKQGIFSDFK